MPVHQIMGLINVLPKETNQTSVQSPVNKPYMLSVRIILVLMCCALYLDEPCLHLCFWISCYGQNLLPSWYSSSFFTGFKNDQSLCVFSEIPDPDVTLVTNWLDVFPSESMKMRCGKNMNTNWKYTWYKDGQEVRSLDTVSFDPDQTTLSIGSASSLHHGRYSCSAKLKTRSVNSIISPELTLSVYGKIEFFPLFCSCHSSNIFKFMVSHWLVTLGNQ